MAVKKENFGGPASAFTEQGHRCVRQRISSPNQARQQPSNITETVSSTHRATETIRDRSRVPSAGSASQSIRPATGAESSTSRDIGQRPSGIIGAVLSSSRAASSSRDLSQAPPIASTRLLVDPAKDGKSPVTSASRQCGQRGSHVAGGAPNRPRGGDDRPEGTISPRRPSVKRRKSPSLGLETAAESPPRPLGGARLPSLRPRLQPCIGNGETGGYPSVPGGYVRPLSKIAYEVQPHARSPVGLSLGPSAASRPSTRPPHRIRQQSTKQHATGPPPGAEAAPAPATNFPVNPSTTPAHKTASDVGPSAGPSSRSETAAKLSTKPRKPGERQIRLCIETEFFLTARQRQQLPGDQKHDFVRILADNYNRVVGNEHPRVRRSMVTDDPGDGSETVFWDQYNEWCFVTRAGLYQTETPGSHKLKMISPTFNVAPNSPWQDHVRTIWRYLSDRYTITNEDNKCYTHIQVSLTPEYELTELQRLASFIIHFETALEALMPENINDTDVAKSHWLMSALLAVLGKNRQESIDFLLSEPTDEESLIHAVQNWDDQEFCWNLLSLEEYGMIEFRKPPASLTADNALSWATLAMSFLLASARHGSAAMLRTLPRNIGGLRSFLNPIRIPGMDVSGHLQRIWRGKDMNAAREPVFTDNYFIHLEGLDKLQFLVGFKRLIEDDARQHRATVPQSQLLQWGSLEEDLHEERRHLAHSSRED